MKLHSLFPGTVSMDALGIKFSVNSALPEAVMTWGNVGVWFEQIVDFTRFSNSRHVCSFVLVQFVPTNFTSSGS